MHNKRKFFGTVRIGEKGQVVIPNKARKKLDLKKGDHLFVFGTGENMITLAKLSEIEKIASNLSKKLEEIDIIINENK